MVLFQIAEVSARLFAPFARYFHSEQADDFMISLVAYTEDTFDTFQILF